MFAVQELASYQRSPKIRVNPCVGRLPRLRGSRFSRLLTLHPHPSHATTLPMRILMATLALAFILSASNACAWSGAGHEVIAAAAYRQLSPKLKAKVTKILQAHPDYEKWK